MMTRVVCLVVCVSMCWACGNMENASNNAVAGTYVREYSKEILNQLSGNKLGMRTVRDTIYISSQGESFQVKNVKWSMNDYDNDGWEDMRHGDSRPLPEFNAVYDEATRTLDNKSTGPDLVLSTDGTLSVGGKSDITYSKIN